jgi:hypothetical protein
VSVSAGSLLSLKVPTRAAISQRDAFGQRRQLAPEFEWFAERRQRFDAPLTSFRLRVSLYQPEEMLVFESCECLVVHGSDGKVTTPPDDKQIGDIYNYGHGRIRSISRGDERKITRQRSPRHQALLRA